MTVISKSIYKFYITSSIIMMVFGLFSVAISSQFDFKLNDAMEELNKNVRFEEKHVCYTGDFTALLSCTPVNYPFVNSVPDAYVIYNNWKIGFNHDEFMSSLMHVIEYRNKGIYFNTVPGRNLLLFDIYRKIEISPYFHDSIPVDTKMAIALSSRSRKVFAMNFSKSPKWENVSIETCDSDKNRICFATKESKMIIFNFVKTGW